MKSNGPSRSLIDRERQVHQFTVADLSCVGDEIRYITMGLDSKCGAAGRRSSATTGGASQADIPEVASS